MTNPKIRKLIFSHIFPLKYLYTLMFFLLLAFVSPLIVLVSLPAYELYSSHPMLFVSFGIFFLFFSIISVFLFVQLKNPFMQEWKDKLGYEEERH
ncbi:MAG: hypothetical protein N3A69_00785 [Leptospiraceae bacterium]|nr:hypothetical protein [Leptospiraceae bacterium]